MNWTKKKIRQFAMDYCEMDVPLYKVESTHAKSVFLMHVYWGRDYHICGVTEQEAIETIDDMIMRSSDDTYTIELYDLNNQGQPVEWYVETQITFKSA